MPGGHYKVSCDNASTSKTKNLLNRDRVQIVCFPTALINDSFLHNEISCYLLGVTFTAKVQLGTSFISAKLRATDADKFIEETGLRSGLLLFADEPNVTQNVDIRMLYAIFGLQNPRRASDVDRCGGTPSGHRRQSVTFVSNATCKLDLAQHCAGTAGRPGLVQFDEGTNVYTESRPKRGHRCERPAGPSLSPATRARSRSTFPPSTKLAHDRTVSAVDARTTLVLRSTVGAGLRQRGESIARAAVAPRPPGVPSLPPALYRSGKWFLNFPALHSKFLPELKHILARRQRSRK
ncbi:unnamed protein product [Leptosia nina]|uniref:Uncharacterized protein n=1 Tax=Leptosia nina TaxID=320188 RepID=A0AAV1J8T5_9NEOP